jgi:mycothiol synthase
VIANWQESEPGEDVREVLLAAMEHDGRPEIVPGEPLPREFRGGLHLLAHDDTSGDGRLVGYGHLDPAGDAFGNQVAELIVHPGHRGRGHGTRLVGEILRKASGPLRIWSHGDHPAAARIAATAGLTKVRELLTMRLDAAVPVTDPDWPEGVTARPFVPGSDEDAVIAVNARAFDWHPEQGRLSVADLEATERESWFDPAGFFLAVDPAGTLLGFHWTKVHPDGVGEVYVVGVDPAAQGGGLGKALTLVGLHHLRRERPRDVILYVESDNAPAVAVYRRLGFIRSSADVQYATSQTAQSR